MRLECIIVWNLLHVKRSKYYLNYQDLGAALGSKRPSTMVLIKEHNEYKSLYNELYEEVICQFAEQLLNHLFSLVSFEHLYPQNENKNFDLENLD